MEWVDGDSLSKIIRAAEQRKQRVPAGIALRIMADAAAGLHAAHELKDRDGHSLGVVHRDVSPQNILISNNGATMLIDFGVAKARDRVSQDTSAGQLKGKIRYMAPEQALGRNIDRRADVWALGAIVYELFSGNSPYEGANEVATLHKLTSGQPPTPLPPTVPPPVKAVIMRALGYDAEHRFATTLELSLALESAMVEIGDPTSITSVAAYTAQLLADRKSARKRAVDAALDTARARDAAGGAPPSTSMAAGGSLVPLAGPSSQNVAAPAQHGHPDLGSRPGGAGSASGVREPPSHPSATSSATLGSAAVEYPPPESTSNPFDQATKRKRYVIAAVLGVSLAAGLVGAVLIVSTAILRSNAPEGSSASSASTSASVGAPPEPTAEPVPVAPIAPAVTTAAPAATTSATHAASAVAAHVPPPEPPPPAAPPRTVNNPPPHKPQPPPPAPPPRPPVAKPAPAPTPTTAKKPDYGI
jgi:serine/threonine-protein kinase